MKELELTLKAFEKRTPKQKQQYILELTRENHKRIKDIKLMLKENNILRKQNINLNKQLEMLCNRYNEKINKIERN